jgi:hypothetical protein
VPTGLAATAGDGQVTLSWTASTGTPAPGYDVEYRTGSGGWTFIGSSRITGTGHTVASLTNGTTYQFRVRASNRHPTTNAWHVSDWTGAVRATPVAAAPTTPVHVAPSVPTGLRATAGDGQVTLTWTASVRGTPAPGYDIQYRTGGGSWLFIGSHLVTGTSHTVSGLDNGDEYEFQVRAANQDAPSTRRARNARNARHTSSWTRSVRAMPRPAHVVPSAPTSLRVVIVGDGEVTLDWTASATGTPVPDYEVRYRRVGSGSWTGIASNLVSGPGHTASGLTNGDEYEFQVRAVNQDASDTWHTSSWTGSVRATPASAHVAPAAPTGLRAVAGDARVALSWTVSTTGTPALGYEIRFRTVGSNHWHGLEGDLVSGTSRTLTGLANGDEYEFRMRAWNQDISGMWRTSSWTGPVTATPSARAAPAKTSYAGAVPFDSAVRLWWYRRYTATGWQYRQKAGGGAWGAWQDIPGSGPYTYDYILRGLTNWVEYTFQVRGVNAHGPGQASNEAKATPFLVPWKPTTVNAVAGDGEVTLSWAGAASSTGAPVPGYEIKYRRVGERSWIHIGTFQISGTSHTVTGLVNRKEYIFRVRATNRNPRNLRFSNWAFEVWATPKPEPSARSPRGIGMEAPTEVAGLPSVSAPATGGAYAAGERIEARVAFTAPVEVDTSGGRPTLTLALGSVRRKAGYESGSGTAVLIFALNVAAADAGAPAARAVPDGLSLNGAAIWDMDGVDARLGFGAALSVADARGTGGGARLPGNACARAHRDGDGALRHRRRHGAGGGGLRGGLGGADLRAGRDGEDGGGAGAR